MNPEAKLKGVAFALLVLALILAFAGLGIALTANRLVNNIGDGLLVSASSVKDILGSYRTIGGIALPLLAVSIGGCAILVFRHTKKPNQQKHAIAGKPGSA
jgi:hypothetical protein